MYSPYSPWHFTTPNTKGNPFGVEGGRRKVDFRPKYPISDPIPGLKTTQKAHASQYFGHNTLEHILGQHPTKFKPLSPCNRAMAQHASPTHAPPQTADLPFWVVPRPTTGPNRRTNPRKHETGPLFFDFRALWTLRKPGGCQGIGEYASGGIRFTWGCNTPNDIILI